MKSGNSFEHCKTHHFDYLNAQNNNLREQELKRRPIICRTQTDFVNSSTCHNTSSFTKKKKKKNHTVPITIH